MSKIVVVTIDGPAGAGKSTAAKALAESLGFHYLNTGSIYRAYTLAAIRKQCDMSDSAALIELLDSVKVTLKLDGSVEIDGQSVDTELRQAEVTKSIHFIANNAEIRARLLGDQHHFATQAQNTVCDGRDTGSVVFPDATVKFFLTASSSERARRRLADLKSQDETNTTSIDELELDIEKRDDSDRNRDVAPLTCPEDAIVVDNSTMNLNETVEFLKKLFFKRKDSLTT